MKENDLIGLTLDGRYRVTDELGAGGMATVYVAQDERLERKVVVKVPHPFLLQDDRFRVRFSREIKSLTKLAHPHVVKVHDVGNVDDVPYAVMEYLDGGSLKDRLEEKGGRETSDDVLDWLLPIASALDHMHEEGVVHRDVKPGNILFDSKGNPVLSDFGIAKALETTEPELTLSGQSPGSPGYMPPEILSGKIAPAYDQYALAAVLFRAVTGEAPQPFQAQTSVTSEVAGRLPLPAAQVLERALSLDQDARYITCVEFAKEFENSLLEEAPFADSPEDTRTWMLKVQKGADPAGTAPAPVGPVSTEPTTDDATAHVPPPPAQKSRLGVWLLVILLLAVGAGVAYWKLRPLGFEAASAAALEKARRLVDDREYVRALSTLEKLVKEHPGEALGPVTRELNRIKREQDTEQTRALAAGGRKYDSATTPEDCDAALEHYREAERILPDSTTRTAIDKAKSRRERLRRRAGANKALATAQEAEQAGDYRTAAHQYEQAAKQLEDLGEAAGPKADAERLKSRIDRYDGSMKRFRESRKDGSRLEEQLKALEEAKKAWPVQFEKDGGKQELARVEEKLALKGKRLAVLDFSVGLGVGSGARGDAAANKVTDVDWGDYEVIGRGERDRIRVALSDLRIGAEDLTNKAKALAFAMAVRAAFAVVGEFSRTADDQVAIRAALIDLRRAAEIQTAEVMVSSTAEIPDALEELVGILRMTAAEKSAHLRERQYPEHRQTALKAEGERRWKDAEEAWRRAKECKDTTDVREGLDRCAAGRGYEEKMAEGEKLLASDSFSAAQASFAEAARLAKRAGIPPDEANGRAATAEKMAREKGAEDEAAQAKRKKRLAYEQAMAAADALLLKKEWKAAEKAYGEAVKLAGEAGISPERAQAGLRTARAGQIETTSYAGSTRSRLTALLAADEWTPADPPTNAQGLLQARHEPTGLVFVLIPAGTYSMGGNEGIAKPSRPVTVPAFLLCRTECTQKAWGQFPGSDARRFKVSDDLPIETVAWKDAAAWCKAAGLRLPSEAEWEYACRGGTTTKFSTGDESKSLQGFANIADASLSRNPTTGGLKAPASMTLAVDDGYAGTAPVGTFQPNPWGLFDMHGNVAEWCEDVFVPGYNGAPEDGSARTGSGDRVVRGGSWYTAEVGVRSGHREGWGSWRMPHIGFRPAVSLP